MNREELLTRIMQVDFTLTDLRLFLNTHPCDKDAIQLFNDTATELKKLKQQYENNYAPLDGVDMSPSNQFEWTNDPWPWQNKGGNR